MAIYRGTPWGKIEGRHGGNYTFSVKRVEIMGCLNHVDIIEEITFKKRNVYLVP